MSKDIRSFFTILKAATATVPKAATATAAATAAAAAAAAGCSKPEAHAGDDSIPPTPDANSLRKKQAKKRRALSDSSDEEKVNKPPHKNNARSGRNVPLKIPLKEVKASEIFGNAPVKRSRSSVPKKTPNLKKSDNSIEIETHSDDDFKETLKNVVSPSSKCEAFKTNSFKIKPSETPQVKNETNGRDNYVCVSNEQLPNGREELAASRGVAETTPVPRGPQGPQDPGRSERTEPASPQATKPKARSTSKYFSPSKKSATQSPQKESKMATEQATCQNSVKNKNISEKTINKVEPEVTKNDKKRDFSEFLSESIDQEDAALESTDHKTKKKKKNVTLNDSALSDEERWERRRASAALYQQYLQRPAPPNLGRKQLPALDGEGAGAGAEGRLRGVAFVVTGVLPSFEREDVAAAIQRCGGALKAQVSSKVQYVVAGLEPGPGKIARAAHFNIPVIDEDELLRLLAEGVSAAAAAATATAASKKKIPANKTAATKTIAEKDKTTTNSTTNKSTKKTRKEENKAGRTEVEGREESVKRPGEGRGHEQGQRQGQGQGQDSGGAGSGATSGGVAGEGAGAGAGERAGALWVDKYRPRVAKQLIGQHGPASTYSRLVAWVRGWEAARRSPAPPARPSPWAKADSGAYYRAALLSGPPGVGKTTMVSVAARELGVQVVELNASDARGRSALAQLAALAGGTRALRDLGHLHEHDQPRQPRALILMEEVDGMAGNEDRGGIQELIAVIKRTRVPVVCTCNDRSSPKLRALANHCFDLRVARPRPDQIKGALLSVCYREGVRVPPETVARIVLAAQCDVRHALHALSLHALGAHAAGGAGGAGEAGSARKDVRLGVWEATRSLLSEQAGAARGMELYLTDYSMAPLFLQENYARLQAGAPRLEALRACAAAAGALSCADVLEQATRARAAWALLPAQAACGGALAAAGVRARWAGPVHFPAYLGRRAAQSRLARLALDLHAALSAHDGGSSRAALVRERAWALVSVAGGRAGAGDAPGAARALHHYCGAGARTLLAALADLTAWPTAAAHHPYVALPANAKSALTRALSKLCGAGGAAAPRARAPPPLEEEEPLAEQAEDAPEQADGDSDSDSAGPEHDALIIKRTQSGGADGNKKRAPRGNRALGSSARGKPARGN